MQATENVSVLELTGGWDTVLEGPVSTALERSLLPVYLPRQRWFGGKARRIETVRLVDWAALPGAPSSTWLAFWEVRFRDGTQDLYFLPLGVTADQNLPESVQSQVLARLRGPAGEAVLHDALAVDAACTALLEVIGSGREFAGRAGRLQGVATAAYAELRGGPEAPLAVERGPATSSNSLVFYGGRLLLKLFRRLEEGINPDFEIGRFLTEKSNFERIPRVAGTLEYHRPNSEPINLAILQEVVANECDGWQHALHELAGYFERVDQRSTGPEGGFPTDPANGEPSPLARETIGHYLQPAATLGRRTAEMHLALAADSRDPAFAPQQLSPADLSALAQETVEQARTALAALRENVERLPEAIHADAQRLLEEGATWERQLATPPTVSPGVTKIRCHGDYHLGQVLWADNDFILLDFEGEPTRSVEQRRARQSPLKDVAGMLRSFDYAAYAGLFAFTRDRPDDFARLEPWADFWRQWTSAVFLHAYQATAGAAAFLPADEAEFAGLLDCFMLDKAFYELAYELNNRPDWVRIPLRSVLALTQERMRSEVSQSRIDHEPSDF